VDVADALHLPLADDAVDLVFTSPPYEDARTLGIGYKLQGDDWVDWAVPRFLECLRVCRGLVAWVVQGRTRNYRWSATPAKLIAILDKAGVCLRNPAIYRRDGIPGSGGPDWWASKYEWIICATRTRGRLSWSDNTATGKPPRYDKGGPCSHRRQDGDRVRSDRSTRHYAKPKLANPGNVVDCGAVGGGHLGSPLSHENEAPFPEALVEPFVRSFCRPGGIVLDPMCGSGTTLAVALKNGRRAVGYDLRDSQVRITRQRVVEEVLPLLSSRRAEVV